MGRRVYDDSDGRQVGVRLATGHGTGASEPVLAMEAVFVGCESDDLSRVWAVELENKQV